MLRLRRPRHATVVAYLALFFALAGSSYAAISITGRDVRDGSLTGRDIRNNSLTGKDLRGIAGREVRNNSLTGADVTKLRRRDFVRGELTPTSQVVVEDARVGPDGGGVVLAKCPTGQVVTGGGFLVGVGAEGHVVASFPSLPPVAPPASPTGWVVVVAGAPPGTLFEAHAVCSG